MYIDMYELFRGSINCCRGSKKHSHQSTRCGSVGEESISSSSSGSHSDECSQFTITQHFHALYLRPPSWLLHSSSGWLEPSGSCWQVLVKKQETLIVLDLRLVLMHLKVVLFRPILFWRMKRHWEVSQICIMPIKLSSCRDEKQYGRRKTYLVHEICYLKSASGNRSCRRGSKHTMWLRMKVVTTTSLLDTSVQEWTHAWSQAHDKVIISSKKMSSLRIYALIRVKSL